MRVLVLGATGATGRHLVEQALERGYQVTAVARTPARVAAEHPELTVVQGEALDQASIERVVPGHDAILSALGPRGMGATTIYSQPARNVLEAMRTRGGRRFICIGSGGVEDDDPSFGFVYKHVVRPLLLRRVYEDVRRMEALLRENLWAEWTVVRPSTLTDEPRTGVYRVSPRYCPPGKKDPTIARADVADFMLGELERREYVHGTPTLAY